MNKEDQEKVRAACRHWISSPSLVKRGAFDIVVGRSVVSPDKWAAMLIDRVDLQDRVWFGAYVEGPTRKGVIGAVEVDL